MEVQNKLKRIVKSHMCYGNCTKKEAEFLISQCIYDIWKTLKNPIVGQPIVAGYNWLLPPASIFVIHYNYFKELEMYQKQVSKVF